MKPIRNIRALITLLIGALCLTPLAKAASGYSMQKAAEAAMRALDGRAEFAFFNLPEPKGDPATLLQHLNQALEAKVPLVIAAPKLEYIQDLLGATMKKAGKKKFEGLVLVVVGPKKDAEMFASLTKERGIKVVSAAYD